MEVFNNKVLMTTDLYPPQFSFDADNYTLRFDLMDTRDYSDICYTLRGSTYNVKPFKEQSYKDAFPVIPLPVSTFSLTYTLTPKNRKYRTFTKTVPIWLNHPRSKEFRYGEDYGTDDKKSPSIYAYIGTNKSVYIPSHHNLVGTRKATLQYFPYVSDNEINISWGDAALSVFQTLDLNRSAAGDKDQRIKTIYNGSQYFGGITDQFSNLPNLELIDGLRLGTVGSIRMFKNCPKLVMDPLLTADMLTINNEAFYNAPLIINPVIAASQIPASSFDYSSDYTGFSRYQKAIFTISHSINGFDEKTLITNEENYNGGMLYTNPETHQVEKHQLFVNFNETAWNYWINNEMPTDDTVELVDYNETMGRFHFHVNDERVFGLKLVVNGAHGILKGAMLWIPSDKRKYDEYGHLVNNALYDDFRTDNDFYISWTHLYNALEDYDPDTQTVNPIGSPGSQGSGTITWETSIVAGVLMSDRISITPITCQGLNYESEYTTTLLGAVNATLPETPITEILYTADQTGSYTLKIDEPSYVFNGYTSGAGYKLYITLDDTIELKKITLRLQNKVNGEWVDRAGTNGKLPQFLDFTNATREDYITVNGKRIYIISLTQDLNYSTETLLYDASRVNLVGSSARILAYYSGYELDSEYTLPLAKKLTGTLN